MTDKIYLYPESNEQQIDWYLNQIALRLELTPTMLEQIKNTYATLTSWLEEDEKFFKYQITLCFSFGSRRIGTSVKPYRRAEFDLDFSIRVTSHNPINPFEIYEHLKRRINENGTYAKIAIQKSRCIRLNYANQYHIDIMPSSKAKPYEDKCLEIMVPDKRLKHWVLTNPEGFAEWFERNYIKVENSLLYRKMISEIKAEIKPLPEEVPYGFKEPLQRAVQLIKRCRDVYFYGKDHNISSIVLTTLSGKHYNGAMSIYDAIVQIIKGIESTTEYSGNFKVINPVNSKEVFNEKWTNIDYKDFRAFISYLYQGIHSLQNSNGYENIKKQIEKLFGEKVSNTVIEDYADLTSYYRKKGRLGINANGSLATSSIVKTIQPNNFYGS